ncbi:MAG: ComF family protein [Acidimicrobiales bacterium]|nr:MAG: ComF family protein [Acidimicrobiales bacterium]
MLFDRACSLCDLPAHGLCADCRDALPAPRHAVPDGLDSLVPIFGYEESGAELLRSLKYANRRAALGPLVEASAPSLPRADLVVPVPVRAERRRSRGYSLPELTAQWLGRMVETPHKRAVTRVDEGVQQGRSREDRLASIRHVARPVVGKRVLLVDDVVTTGATLSSCALALRAAGATEVHGFVLAATPAAVQSDDAALWSGGSSADTVSTTN